jgi:hypothetical protein
MFSEDMQTLFDPVISQITSLVGEQVKEAKAKKNATIDVLTDPSRISILFPGIILTSSSH